MAQRVDPLVAGQPTGSPGPAFPYSPVYLQAGRTYTISLSSSQFDTYLYVLNCNGQIMRRDDDGGAGLNSRIVFTPNFSGTYEIMATTFARDQTGCYDLRLGCYGGSPYGNP